MRAAVQPTTVDARLQFLGIYVARPKIENALARLYPSTVLTKRSALAELRESGITATTLLTQSGDLDLRAPGARGVVVTSSQREKSLAWGPQPQANCLLLLCRVRQVTRA